MTQQKKPTAFMKPVQISAQLEQIIGQGPMPRTEVTKKLWDYIKQKQLQNPKNRRQILPDSPLAKVLGSSEPIDMFKLTGAVSKHIQECKPALAKN